MMKKILVLVIFLLVAIPSMLLAAQKEVGVTELRYTTDGESEAVNFRFVESPLVATMLVKYEGGNPVAFKNNFFNVRVKKTVDMEWIIENTGDEPVNDVTFQTGLGVGGEKFFIFQEWRQDNNPLVGGANGTSNFKFSLAAGAKTVFRAIAQTVRPTTVPVAATTK